MSPEFTPTTTRQSFERGTRLQPRRCFPTRERSVGDSDCMRRRSPTAQPPSAHLSVSASYHIRPTYHSRPHDLVRHRARSVRAPSPSGRGCLTLRALPRPSLARPPTTRADLSCRPALAWPMQHTSARTPSGKTRSGSRSATSTKGGGSSARSRRPTWSCTRSSASGSALRRRMTRARQTKEERTRRAGRGRGQRSRKFVLTSKRTSPR